MSMHNLAPQKILVLNDNHFSHIFSSLWHQQELALQEKTKQNFPLTKFHLYFSGLLTVL